VSRALAQALLTEHFGPFGPLKFPYQTMGKIDSLHLFGEPELQIFAMYHAHRGRWKKVLDIGANLGLHSIIMARSGFTVKAYEPDFEHYDHLLANLEANDVSHLVTPHMAAVHTEDGEANFVRVLNNLTGNHLDGYKDSFGPRETVIVPTVDCRPLWRYADFAKIDSEGNEADLLLTMTPNDLNHLQAVVEVRNEENASKIYRHFCELEVPLWSAKTNWERVRVADDMPRGNREGPIFVGHAGPWE
jgi:FkbM family methyltransferase